MICGGAKRPCCTSRGADADPIVRACLDDGKISALSLAFDCTENGRELAPDLRERLGQTVAAAFHCNADRDRRRLVASVLATRHLRELISTKAGSRLCPRPIPASLSTVVCFRDAVAVKKGGDYGVRVVVDGDRRGSGSGSGIRRTLCAARSLWSTSALRGPGPGVRDPGVPRSRRPRCAGSA